MGLRVQRLLRPLFWANKLVVSTEFSLLTSLFGTPLAIQTVGINLTIFYNTVGPLASFYSVRGYQRQAKFLKPDSRSANSA